MSLANDLINSLAKAGVETEDLTTLVIDHYTRTINIPKGITTLGVESDDEVLRLNFKMPRYLGTVDLYNFNIRINYINQNGDEDVYQVTDKAIVGSNIAFSWLVGPTATAYKGVTKFNVCMVITDANSVIKQEYNTAIASLPVLQGLECSERVISDYTDILEQWERRLFGIGDTEEANLVAVSEQQQTAIADKGAEVMATIPADYQAAVKMAEEGARTKADAIIRTAEGESIVVSDSSDDLLRGLKIFGKTTQVKTTGKNLLKVTATSSTINGIAYTVNADGSIRANGTATDDAFLTVGTMTYVGGTEYEISGCPSNGNMNTYTLYAVYGDGLYAFDIGSGKTYTPATDMIKTVSIRVTKGVTVSNLIYWPMVRLASNADDSYEFYTGGAASPSPEWPQELASIENPKVNVYGKNLLNITATTQTLNGITFTVNDDKTIVINGTATADAYCGLTQPDILNPGKYILSGCTDGSSNTYFLYTDTGAIYNRDSEVEFTVDTPSEKKFLIKVHSGVTVNNAVVKPMLRLAAVDDGTYEAPSEAQQLLLTHSLPGIPIPANISEAQKPFFAEANYTDPDGQQWICDEIDFERGVYVQRVGSTSGLTFTLADGTGYPVGNSLLYCARLPGNLGPSINRNRYALCDKLPFSPNVLNNDISGFYVLNARIYARIPGVADVNTFNTLMANAKFQIALEPAVETPLTSDELAAFKALRTNRPNTTVMNDAGAQMEMSYNADTEIWLDNRLAEKLPHNSWRYQEYGLPVLSLTGDTTGMTKENAVTMDYRYSGRSGTCTVKWQGTSSLAHPKKNYTVKFDTEFEAKTGWGAQKKYCLKANFIDPSHARNIMSARLWSKVVGLREDGLFGGLPQHGAIDGFPIVVEINGEFMGLYTFNIPKDGWMFGLSESDTLMQAIVCAEGKALDDACSFNKLANVDGNDFSLEYVSDENNSAWVQTSLNGLINACMNSNGTDLDTTIAQYLDWRSAIDFYVFTCLIGAYDLMVKNYLLVTLDGTKWYFSVYDMDSTYGLETNGKGFRDPIACYPHPTPMGSYHRLMKMIINHKKDEFKARYAEIRELLYTNAVHTDFYNFATAIPQTILSEDWRKWPTIPGTSCNNVAQIMDWYRSRLEYIDSKVDAL